jgi:hypothetical protein
MESGAKLSDIDANSKHRDAWRDLQDTITKYCKTREHDAFVSINNMILQFLELPRPILQDSLADCLELDGILEFYIAQITRCGAGDEKSAKEILAESKRRGGSNATIRPALPTENSDGGTLDLLTLYRYIQCDFKL